MEKRLRIMQCLRPLFVCMVFALLLGVRTEAQVLERTKITESFQEEQLSSRLKKIQDKTGLTIAFEEKDVQQKMTAAARFTNVSLQQVLQQSLKGYSLGYKEMQGVIVVFTKPVESATNKKNGAVSGTIIDEEGGDPVQGATVVIGGQTLITDIEGVFSAQLPEGKYTATVTSIGYGTKNVTDVVVKENIVAAINITLKRQKGNLQGVVVTSSVKNESVASLYVRQKSNAAISDGISAEQIRRTPDNNVAQVLKRVSGLTVQENKFVTVRGMSERYNNVLLNGASLPSTEPNRRNFSFDIIPANLIDNVVVNKTATPDLPGEFSGGMVQVSTIDVPRENFIQVGIGSGFNTNSTGKDFYSTKRYSSDFRASAGDNRNWFGNTFQLNEYEKAYSKYTLDHNDQESFAVLKKMGASIPNNYGIYKYKAQPLQTYQLSLGGRKQFKNGSSLGIVLAGSYRHEETIDNYDARLRKGPTVIDSAHVYDFTTAIGAVGNIAYQYKGTKIVWRNLYNRRFNHETNYRKAADLGGSGYNVMQREYSSVVEQADLFHTRLEGDHLLNTRGMKFDWFADLAKVVKEQPDNRYSQANIVGYDSVAQREVLEYQYNGIQGSLLSQGGLFASKLEENKKNIGGNFQYPFQLGGFTQKVKAGYWGTFRNADYQQVALIPKGVVDEATLKTIGYGKGDYQMWDPKYFSEGYYYYAMATSTGWGVSDAYKGKQQLHAFYLMTDITPYKNLRVNGGVRLEDNSMTIQSLTRNTTTNNVVDSTIKYQEKNWLPSVNAIYSITPKINVRASYYQTVARADFRERAPYAYYDFTLRQTVLGAVGLKNSSIKNADLRLEWYPGAGEVISITGFYKKFTDPVEMVSYKGSDGNYLLFYYNLSGAENKGIEFDVRKSFAFIRPSSGFLNNLFISANFTYMDSKVNYDPNQLLAAAQGLPIPPKNETASRNRPLTGLSPYIINGGLSYQGNVIGANVTYNRYGRRVLFAGEDEYDDTYENPRDVLDFQLSARLLKKKLELRFNISDLLHQDFVEYYNKNKATAGNNDTDAKGLGYNKDSDVTLRKIQRGANYSFTVSYRF